MQTWSLATMSAADIDGVLGIEKISFKKPWTRKSYLDELACDDSCTLIVRQNRYHKAKKIIAYSCFRLFAEEMHILKIAVDPEWRKCGVSSWLLEKSIQAASKKGAKAAFLEVRPSNDMAVLLYKKFGFKIIGKRKNYYPENREDALVMMKHFKEATT